MSSGNSISVTVPICTPTSRTGDPSVKPLVLSKRVQYLLLRENRRCSLLTAMTPTAKRIRPIETKAPTLISLVALDSRNRPFPAAAQEVTQARLPGLPCFLHAPDEIHPTLEQGGYAIAYQEGACDVVRHHDRRHLESPLQIADHLVDGRGRDRVQPRGRLVVKDTLGIHGDRARQRHAFLHPSGQLGGHEVLDPLQPHEVQLA